MQKNCFDRNFCWVTRQPTRYYSRYRTHTLQSPVFDFSALQTDPILRFGLFVSSDSLDGIQVQVSTDNLTFTTLGNVGDVILQVFFRVINSGNKLVQLQFCHGTGKCRMEWLDRPLANIRNTTHWCNGIGNLLHKFRV